MSKKLIDILPKISQWESIPYSPWLECGCQKSGFGPRQDKPKLIGWCDTDFGYMAVFECQLCFEKFRFHAASDPDKYELPALERGLRCFMGICSNEEELELKLEEELKRLKGE